MGVAKYQHDGPTRTSGPGFGVTIHPDALQIPLRWRTPRLVFVNSMSDLFHHDVPDDFIAQVWAVMSSAAAHTFQVLTKRPARMRSLLDSERFWQAVAAHSEQLMFTAPGRWQYPPGYGLRHRVLPHVWLGVSVEDQRWADIRIPALRQTAAAVRFLSCEPLIGPIDLDKHLFPAVCPGGCRCRRPDDGDRHECGCGGACADWRPRPALDWVIAGGESGPSARPMHLDWVRELRDQCSDSDVPFFFKQWGGRTPKIAGRELDGRRWSQMPTPSPSPLPTKEI
ncbi:DUF5131 family protein [Nocardia sp. NPDC006044]|uniref:DUF5131 family protein n=1 Tax=Nocardia sp. NPDC006044 TaxID=3364306 RepID=UPI0036B64BC0